MSSNISEIRVRSDGYVRNYSNYAIRLIEDGVDTIKAVAMGNAITKLVAIAELVKRRRPGLHQYNATHSVAVTDTFQDGDRQEVRTKYVPALTITLSTVPLQQDGYQPPSSIEEAQTTVYRQPNNRPPRYYPNEGENAGEIKGGRGRGRGRGYGGRGYGGRGYNNRVDGGRGGRGNGRRGPYPPGQQPRTYRPKNGPLNDQEIVQVPEEYVQPVVENIEQIQNA